MNAHLLSNILDTKLGEWSPNSRLIGKLNSTIRKRNLTSKLI